MKRLIPSVVFGLALLLLPGLAWAQQGTVTGTVTEAETGDPLPGATVQVVDENTGAASDADGQYRITGVPAGEQALRVSFVGYQEQERTVNVPAGGTVRVNFQLQTSQAQLEEVVVSSYAVEEDVRVTGASESVSGEDIATQDVQNVSGALQGRASGIRITSQSGAPGSAFDVQVRGQATITGGQQPLYIVDGVQVGPENISNEGNLSPLAGLEPSDVESIQVLKDASATAIYGARAANGVVLIQTKGGGGETRVSFNAELGSVSPLEQYDILSASDWAEYTFREGRNAGSAPATLAAAYNIPITNPEEVSGPNWYDSSTRTGLTQSYQLSVSGGDEETSFRLAGTFERDKGQVIQSFLNQAGIRANVQHDVTDDLTVSSKLNAVQNKSRGTIGGGAFINSPFWAAYLIRPHLQVRNDDGSYNLPLEGGGAFNRRTLTRSPRMAFRSWGTCPQRGRSPTG